MGMAACVSYTICQRIACFWQPEPELPVGIRNGSSFRLFDEKAHVRKRPVMLICDAPRNDRTRLTAQQRRHEKKRPKNSP